MATIFGSTWSVICFISSSLGRPCSNGIGRPPINANSAGAPCTCSAWAMDGLEAISIRDSWIWPFIALTASASARAIGNRRSSVGIHRNSRIGKVVEVCTIAWNVFSVVSIT